GRPAPSKRGAASTIFAGSASDRTSQVVWRETSVSAGKEGPVQNISTEPAGAVGSEAGPSATILASCSPAFASVAAGVFSCGAAGWAPASGVFAVEPVSLEGWVCWLEGAVEPGVAVGRFFP